MNKFKILGFGIILFSITTIAQINVENISVNGGMIRNYLILDKVPEKYSFVSELSFGGKFLHENLEWDLFFSYWNDNSRTKIFIIDAPTYEYDTFTYGLRFYFRFADFQLFSKRNTFSIFTGAANFIKHRIHLSRDYGQNSSGKDTTTNELNILLGIKNKFLINENWGVNISFSGLYYIRGFTHIHYQLLTGVSYHF